MEAIKLLSMFTALGALTWMGYEVIATSDEFGFSNRNEGPGLKTPGLVFLIAILVNIVASRLDRRKRK